MPALTVIQGVEPGKRHWLARELTLIGRSPTCDLVLLDPTVSRRHVQIEESGERYWIEDLGSHHGTLLDGAPIQGRSELREGAEIRLGECVLSFHVAAPPPARPTSGPRTHSPLDAPPLSPGPSDGVQFVDDLLDPQTDSVLDGRDSGIDDHHAPQRLRALLELIESVGVSLDLAESLPRILACVLRLFPNANRGSILVDSSGRLEPLATLDRDGRSHDAPQISRTIVNQVMTEAKAVLVSDAWSDLRYQTESVYRLDLRSVMCAPLIEGPGRPGGMIHVDSRDPTRPFTPDDLRVLIGVANVAGHLVAHARLHNAQLAVERQRQDLRLARRLQLNFLPRAAPSCPGYQVAQHYQAAAAVGGDYFQYLPLPDGRLAIAVADVAGKGVAAAMVMARLCSDVRYALAANPQVADAVAWLNDHVCLDEQYERSVTLVVGVLDPRTHRIELVNAGHPPPWWRPVDGPPEPLAVDHSGPPLGVIEGRSYPTRELQLEPGQLLLFFTDGVTEARSPAGRMFGAERLRHAVRLRLDATGYVAAVRQELRSFVREQPPSDDICVIALTRDGEEGTRL